MAYLVFKHGAQKGRRIEIDADEIRLGSNPRAQVRIDDPGVADLHAIIRRRGDRYMVEDRGSKRGTYLEGKRIKIGELHEGGTLKLGKATLTFHFDLEKPTTKAKEKTRPVYRSDAGIMPTPGQARTKPQVKEQDDIDLDIGKAVRNALSDYKQESERQLSDKKIKFHLPSKRTMQIALMACALLAAMFLFSLIAHYAPHRTNPQRPDQVHTRTAQAPPRVEGTPRDVRIKLDLGQGGNDVGSGKKIVLNAPGGGGAGGGRSMGGGSAGSSNMRASIEIAGTPRKPNMAIRQSGGSAGGSAAPSMPSGGSGAPPPPSKLDSGAPMPDMAGMMDGAGGGAAASGMPMLPKPEVEHEEWDPDNMDEEGMSEEDREELRKALAAFDDLPEEDPKPDPADPAPPPPVPQATAGGGSVSISYTPGEGQVKRPRMLRCELEVSDYLLPNGGLRAVLPREDGSFTVYWIDGRNVFSRTFHHSGLALGERQKFVLDEPLELGRNSIAVTRDGEQLVVYQDFAADGHAAIYLRRFSAAGEELGDPQRVDQGEGLWASNPAISATQNGRIAVVWQSLGADGEGWAVMARMLGDQAAPLGSAFVVNEHAPGDQGNPSTALAADGTLAVTWTSVGQDGFGCGIFARLFDAQGKPLDEEFRVNRYCWWDQNWPAVAVGNDGSIAISYASFHQDRSSWGVFVRRFDSTGEPLGNEQQVNLQYLGDQSWPCVALGRRGEMFVAWASGHLAREDWQVLARLYDQDGRPRLVP
ncbi:MAG: FHA domain-containing protein [Candidatus Alcyoniella australis]|nr:FHA domain-containing protein [Candidatus Alcyoniella australis]